MGKSVRTLEERLFGDPCSFDFFQAVRILHRLDPSRARIGGGGPPSREAVRFRTRPDLVFPPSAIYDLARGEDGSPPLLTQPFFGLVGINGVLPRHYSELLTRVERETKHPERFALRDFLEIFNHRLLSLFYRAWEKYRFAFAFEHGDYEKADPDSFSKALFSVVGLGQPQLRKRLAILLPRGVRRAEAPRRAIDDISLFYYAGALAHRPRTALMLENVLADYFGRPARVLQFQGRRLRLEPVNQTRLGVLGGNAELGVSTIAGERVWNAHNKIRIRVGPLDYASFDAYLPERGHPERRGSIFLTALLTRLYVGPELDFDVQLVLRAADVRPTQLNGAANPGPRLGWNVWLQSRPCARDADDAVFESEDLES